jgi:hypothetical protein
VAAVELAVLLPLLAFLFVIGVDFARLFYYSMTVQNCARNGALYGCDPTGNALSPYASVTDASLADSSNLSPAPNVTCKYGTGTNGNYIEVTVTYTFHTITQYPGVPSQITISRSERMRMVPQLPNF